MNIVGLGGGTGLPVLLRGLKHLGDRHLAASEDDQIRAAAIVCVSDDGGSSGVLRQAFDIPAVGDLRNCLVALSAGNPTLRDIFQYRLRGDFGLDGHSLGNLIVAALSARSGNLRNAIQLASEFLHLQGRVLPSTERSVCLCAEFDDGDSACGETAIATRHKPIRRVWLDPHASGGDHGCTAILPAPGVLDAIRAADAVILGPGSLYTSIIPCLLPEGVAEAVRESPALKILVCNLMMQPGETGSFSAADHVRALRDYLDASAIQICLLNSRAIPAPLAKSYAETGAAPVSDSIGELERLGIAPICLDLLDPGEPEARHDSFKLARAVVSLTRAYQRARDMRMGDVHCFAAAAVPVLS